MLMEVLAPVEINFGNPVFMSIWKSHFIPTSVFFTMCIQTLFSHGNTQLRNSVKIVSQSGSRCNESEDLGQTVPAG